MKLLNEINNNDYDNNSEELITYQFLYSLCHNDRKEHDPFPAICVISRFFKNR